MCVQSFLFAPVPVPAARGGEDRMELEAASEEFNGILHPQEQGQGLAPGTAAAVNTPWSMSEKFQVNYLGMDYTRGPTRDGMCDGMCVQVSCPWTGT